jgi:formiminotetrahydrofolate cyclodeaminase
MSLAQLPFTELLRAFQSQEPTPGGGSASALAGAVGASLLAMVAGLPKPRVQDPDQAQRLAAAGAGSAAISGHLSVLIDRDSDAYNLVVAAFRLPRTTDEEKQARTRQIQDALRIATQAPLDVMRECAGAMQLAGDVAALGNRNASSDVQVAVELLRAALRGAKLNVEANLASLTDDTFKVAVRGEVERLVVEGEQRAAAALGSLESGR